MKFFNWIRWLFLGKRTADKPIVGGSEIPLYRGHVPPRPLPPRNGNIPSRRDPGPLAAPLIEQRGGNTPPRRNPGPLSALAPARAQSRRSSDDSDPVPAILMSNTFQGIAGTPVQHCAPARHDSIGNGHGTDSSSGSSDSE